MVAIECLLDYSVQENANSRTTKMPLCICNMNVRAEVTSSNTESVNQELLISITRRSPVMRRTGTCRCGSWLCHCFIRCDYVLLGCRVCCEYSGISVPGWSEGRGLRDSGPEIPTPRFRPSSPIDVHGEGTRPDPFREEVQEQEAPFREHLFRNKRMVWIGKIATQTPRVRGNSVEEVDEVRASSDCKR